MPKSSPTAGHTTSGGLGSQGELREQGGPGFSRGVVRAYIGAPGLWARRGEGFVASSAERLHGVGPGEAYCWSCLSQEKQHSAIRHCERFGSREVQG